MKIFPIFNANERKAKQLAQQEAFEKRGKELKPLIHDAFVHFVETHCEFNYNFMTPILVFMRAWTEYCKVKGISQEITEYFFNKQTNYYSAFGNPCLLTNYGIEYPRPENDYPLFYIGMRIKTWPNENHDNTHIQSLLSMRDSKYYKEFREHCGETSG